MCCATARYRCTYTQWDIAVHAPFDPHRTPYRATVFDPFAPSCRDDEIDPIESRMGRHMGASAQFQEPVKRRTVLPDFSAFGVETIRVRDHPDFAGLKVFQCVRLNATITPKSCASNHARAECSSVCFRCPIGEHHSATHEPIIASSTKREFGSPARDAGLSCIRCLRTERTATKHIGRFRLVKQHTVCVSCANREYEKIKGLNSKGAKPVKWSHLKQATITIETDSGEWKTLDIGLRAGRGECERYVERVHSGCELIEVFIDGEAIPEGTPDEEPNKSRSWRERSASETAAEAEADERVHDDRDVKDQLDDSAALQARGDPSNMGIFHISEPDPLDAGKAKAPRKRGGQFVDLTGHRYNLLTAIRFLHKDQRGKSVWLWQCDCGEKTLATANNVRTNNTISCGCFLESSIRQRSQVGGPLSAHEIAEWREYVEPCPINRMSDEGGMQYAPAAPLASIAEPGALPKVAQPVQQPQRAPEPVKYDMKTRAGRRAFEKALRKEQQQKQREQNELSFPSVANTAKAFIHVMYEIGTRS